MADQIALVANDPTLAEIVRRLVETFQPLRIYLFGSKARGDAGPDSDYDLLIQTTLRKNGGRAGTGTNVCGGRELRRTFWCGEKAHSTAGWEWSRRFPRQ
jgi:hypothetical protein